MFLTENPIGTHVFINGIEYVIEEEWFLDSCKGCDLFGLNNECIHCDRERCIKENRNDNTGIIFRRCCNVAKLHP